MKVPRRRFLHLASGAAMAAISRPAWPQAYPARAVRLIVGYAAGGGSDAVARTLAVKLSSLLGQQFVVENRTGASGMMGAQTVATAEPDGYTLLVGSPPETALDQNLFRDMKYDPLKDLTPITLLAWSPLVLAAHPSFEASNLMELVKLAQARDIDFSSPGVGSSHHLTGEYLNKLISGKLSHIAYRGAAPAVTDAVAGHVKLTISGLPAVVPFLQSGALKAIAVTNHARSPMFPDIPAMSETLGFEEFDFTVWFGLLARTGTPTAILERLQSASVVALKDAQVRKILVTQAAEPIGSTSDDFRKFIRSEAAKYAKIVKLTGVAVN
jgi:tripartite-type tricarboxylate transporter receptor subunit TctC